MIIDNVLKYGILIVVSYAIAALLILIIQKTLGTLINKNSKLLGDDATAYIFLKNSSSFIILIITTIWIFNKIPYFNSLGSALFAGAGILAAVIGFASQKAFSNIIGGLFIIIFKPFKIGDVIELSNIRKGIVEEITLRHTIIRDFEFRRIIVPNGIINDETIINSNFNDKHIRKHIEIGVSYDTNLDKAIKLLREIVENNPNCLDNRTELEIENGIHKVEIRVTALGEYAITLKAYAWTKNNLASFDLYTQTLKEVKEKFDEVGIEIPFPYRTLVFKDEKISEKINNL